MSDSAGDSGLIPSDLLRRLQQQIGVINLAPSQVVGFRDGFARAVATVDAALEQARPAFGALALIGAALREAIPSNWDLDRVDVDAGVAIVQQEGIPLAWVPKNRASGQPCGSEQSCGSHSVAPGSRS